LYQRPAAPEACGSRGLKHQRPAAPEACDTRGLRHQRPAAPAPHSDSEVNSFLICGSQQLADVSGSGRRTYFERKINHAVLWLHARSRNPGWSYRMLPLSQPNKGPVCAQHNKGRNQVTMIVIESRWLVHNTLNHTKVIDAFLQYAASPL